MAGLVEVSARNRTAVQNTLDVMVVACVAVSNALGQPAQSVEPPATHEQTLAACEAASAALDQHLANDPLSFTITSSPCELDTAAEASCVAACGTATCIDTCGIEAKLDQWECTDVTVSVQGADAPLQMALEEHLPAILKLRLPSSPLLDGAGELSAAHESLLASIASTEDCTTLETETLQASADTVNDDLACLQTLAGGPRIMVTP